MTGTATFGLIFGGPRVFYDDTKEGGCTTTVQADEPGETNGNNDTDATIYPFLKKENRISTSELSKVNNRTSEIARKHELKNEQSFLRES